MTYEKRVQQEQAFYTECAKILDIDYKYVPPFLNRTRWNVRTLGNSRFAGYGTIQMFNTQVIRVMFRDYRSGTFDSPNAVFEFLKEVKNENIDRIM